MDSALNPGAQLAIFSISVNPISVSTYCFICLAKLGSLVMVRGCKTSSARVLIIAPNNFLFKNDVLLSLACGHSVDYHITRASDDAVVRHVPWNLDVAAFADSFLNWL